MHGGTYAHAGKRENREELRRRKSAGCGEREGVRDGVRGGTAGERRGGEGQRKRNSEQGGERNGKRGVQGTAEESKG